MIGELVTADAGQLAACSAAARSSTPTPRRSASSACAQATLDAHGAVSEEIVARDGARRARAVRRRPRGRGHRHRRARRRHPGQAGRARCGSRSRAERRGAWSTQAGVAGRARPDPDPGRVVGAAALRRRAAGSARARDSHERTASEGKRLFVGRAGLAGDGERARRGRSETLARERRDGGLDLQAGSPPASYHVTLKFLGWTRDDGGRGGASTRWRAAAAGARAFTFETARLGAFPSLDKASVVWAGVEEPSGALAALARGGRGGDGRARLRGRGAGLPPPRHARPAARNSRA